MTHNDVVGEYKGQTFRFNEVVHIFEGTHKGVRAEKTEFLKAWYSSPKPSL
jgi:hypothetical protein